MRAVHHEWGDDRRQWNCQRANSGGALFWQIGGEFPAFSWLGRVGGRAAGWERGTTDDTEGTDKGEDCLGKGGQS